MKPPTERQLLFARRIAHFTGVPLPEEETSQAYFYYIRDNIEKYKNRVKVIRHEVNVMRHEKAIREKYNSRNERTSYMDEEQDAAWAASMDFGWM